MQVIQPPKWYRAPNVYKAEGGWKPDYLRFDIDSFGVKTFYILDAKYYYPTWNESTGKILSNPGVADVAKQYLYQLAYNRFLKSINVDNILNFFVMPIDDDTIQDAGFAVVDVLHRIPLRDIRVRQVPAKEIYEFYLNDKTKSPKELI